MKAISNHYLLSVATRGEPPSNNYIFSVKFITKPKKNSMLFCFQSSFFLKNTQYNVDAHNAHAPSPLRTHVCKP